MKKDSLLQFCDLFDLYKSKDDPRGGRLFEDASVPALATAVGACTSSRPHWLEDSLTRTTPIGGAKRTHLPHTP